MNWHILDPLGGEDWIRFMCEVGQFEYSVNGFFNTASCNFLLPSKPGPITITTGGEVLTPDMNWYRIHNNSESSPFILIGRKLILPGQADLAVRHFENLTGLFLSF